MRRDDCDGKGRGLRGEDTARRGLAFWLVVYAVFILMFGAVAGTGHDAGAETVTVRGAGAHVHD